MADYKQQAQEEYDPTWNAKRIALINQTLGQKTNLSNQIGGINANYDNQEATANKTYDMQVGNQNLNNTATKNNMSNSALGRGISRSSIIQSQLAEADQANNRVVNNINTDRTGTLNSIATNRTNDINSINNNITTLDNNLQNSLTDLDNNRQNEINTLARTLEDRAYARQLQERQMSLSESNAAADRAYKNATLALQSSKASTSSQDKQAAADTKQLTTDYSKYLSVGQQMQKAKTKDGDGVYQKNYSDEDLYNWIKDLDLPGEYKAKLAETLNISKPAYISTNSYYEPGQSNYKAYSGGR